MAKGTALRKVIGGTNIRVLPPSRLFYIKKINLISGMVVRYFTQVITKQNVC